MTVVALLLAGTAPAYASGGADKGPVGVGVIGEGLTVNEARATLNGWYPGARAETFLLRGGKHIPGRPPNRWSTAGTNSKSSLGR